MISIDKSKCIGCGNCIDKCPCRSIDLIDAASEETAEDPIIAKATSEMHDKRNGRLAEFHPERGCIKCMHCGSACPNNAISYNGNTSIYDENIPTLSEGFAHDLDNMIRMRRSYRLFKDKMVPIEEIEHALDVASWAPSAKNQHPVKYYLIRGREQADLVTGIVMDDIREKQDQRLELLQAYEAGNNKMLGTATTAILAYARNNAVNPQTDTAIKLTTAELVLQSRGFGTCWSGYLMRNLNNVEKLRDYFPLPENNQFYGCLLVGYPDETYCHIPERIKRPDIKYMQF